MNKSNGLEHFFLKNIRIFGHGAQKRQPRDLSSDGGAPTVHGKLSQGCKVAVSKCQSG
jgi:hypothetical protein